MPNSVSSHSDRTIFKVLKALTEGEAMSLEQAMDAVNRMQNAGILFREPAEKEEKVTRNGKTEAAAVEGE